MVHRRGVEVRQEGERREVAHAGRRDAAADAAELPELAREHLCAHVVAHAGAHKGAEHLDGAAAQQKHERAACARRGESELEAPVIGVGLLHHVEQVVEAAHREPGALGLDLVDVVFHQPDAVGVHAGRGQAHDLAEALVPLDAGALDGQQREVDVDRHAEHARHAVHGVAHAPGSGAGREHELTRPADDRRLVGQGRVHGELVAGAHDLVPNRLHVMRVHPHSRRAHRPFASIVCRAYGSPSGEGRAAPLLLVSFWLQSGARRASIEASPPEWPMV